MSYPSAPSKLFIAVTFALLVWKGGKLLIFKLTHLLKPLWGKSEYPAGGRGWSLAPLILLLQYPDWSSWWWYSPAPRSSCTRGSIAAHKMIHQVQEPILTFLHQWVGQRMGYNVDDPLWLNRRELPKLFYLPGTFNAKSDIKISLSQNFPTL